MNHYVRPSGFQKFIRAVNWPRVVELACYFVLILILISIGIVFVAPEGWRGR